MAVLQRHPQECQPWQLWPSPDPKSESEEGGMGKESNTTQEKLGSLEEFKIALFTEKSIICCEQK